MLLRGAVSVPRDGDVGLYAALGGEGGGGIFANLGIAVGGVLGALAGCSPVSGGRCH